MCFLIDSIKESINRKFELPIKLIFMVALFIIEVSFPVGTAVTMVVQFSPKS